MPDEAVVSEPIELSIIALTNVPFRVKNSA